MIQTIILDFDGVILESVSVKTEAFRTLFSFAPEHIEEIVDFHIKNGGMSRFDKFRYIYKNILKEDLPAFTFNSLSKKFSHLVFEGVINAPFVPGAREFLETFYVSLPLYVLSATPEEELKNIIQKRGIAPYFRGIFGSPRKKTECIRDILSDTRISASDVVFVGDAPNDLDAARAAHVRFIERLKPGDENLFEECDDVELVISDLHELTEYIEEIQ
jgi:beta-phosphoglucomutase